jgi:hypothetical protein
MQNILKQYHLYNQMTMLVIVFFTTSIACQSPTNKNNPSKKIHSENIQFPKKIKKIPLTNAQIDSLIKEAKPQKYVFAKNSIFKKVQFIQVIWYACIGETAENKILHANKKLARVVLHQKQMTEAQVENLSTILSDTTNYNGQQAACFTPGIGIVFFQNQRIVGQLLICLSCNNFESSKKIKLLKESFSPNGIMALMQLHGDLSY